MASRVVSVAVFLAMSVFSVTTAQAVERNLRLIGQFGGFQYLKFSAGGRSVKTTTFGTFAEPGIGLAGVVAGGLEIGGLVHFGYSKLEATGLDSSSTTNLGAKLFIDYVVVKRNSFWLGLGGFIDFSRSEGSGDDLTKTIAGGPLVNCKFFVADHLSIDIDGVFSIGSVSTSGTDLDMMQFGLLVGFSGWL